MVLCSAGRAAIGNGVGSCVSAACAAVTRLSRGPPCLCGRAPLSSSLTFINTLYRLGYEMLSFLRCKFTRFIRYIIFIESFISLLLATVDLCIFRCLLNCSKCILGFYAIVMYVLYSECSRLPGRCRFPRSAAFHAAPYASRRHVLTSLVSRGTPSLDRDQCYSTCLQCSQGPSIHFVT